MHQVFLSLLLGCLALPSNSFLVTSPVATQRQQLSMIAGPANGVSRRAALAKGIATLAAGVAASLPAPASANAFPGSDKLLTGYKELRYLLDNWDKVTTKCDANGQCEKNPDIVRKYLGLRSTTDPLFQVEKTLSKAQAFIEDPDELEAYAEAADMFQSTQAMANSMAFTSSFGEYNPGGGKDQVAKYLEESRKQVVQATAALGEVVRILGLQ